MPQATLSGADIYYEETGSESGERLFMINGWSSQLIAWHPELVSILADAGFRVVCFDNRDTGMSTKCADRPEYTMSDMARDVADLIEHLGYESPHVVGQSMGGMIAQTLTVEHTERVRSLTSVYSSSSVGTVKVDASKFPEFGEPTHSREEAVAMFLEREKRAGTNGFERHMEELAERHYDRGYCPDGVVRQRYAIQSMEDLRPMLARIDLLASIIHGRRDQLLPIDGAIASFEALPHAEVHLSPDMGHEMKRSLWPDLVDVIGRSASHARAPVQTQEAQSTCYG